MAYNPDRAYTDQRSDCSISWGWPSAHYPWGPTPGTYPLTVTVVYRVAWAGAGRGGTLADITRSVTVPYPVGEIEAIRS